MGHKRVSRRGASESQIMGARSWLHCVPAYMPWLAILREAPSSHPTSTPRFPPAVARYARLRRPGALRASAFDRCN
eukprot:5190668-Alexandrium_andersonii.AAC.1